MVVVALLLLLLLLLVSCWFPLLRPLRAGYRFHK